MLATSMQESLEIGMEPVPGYQLVQPIGQGGSGEVWEAIAPNGNSVALKFIVCKHQSSMTLANEVRVLLRLRDLKHPYIIKTEDVIATSHYLVMVMELAEGSLEDLRKVYWHELQQPIPTDHLLELLTQAAEALDFLAEQPAPHSWGAGMGLQHCDVKPSNLLLLEDKIKVADFGLCMSSLAQTRGKQFVGTRVYAAPELYEGKVTAQTDQYSLAVTYCVLATGGRVLVDNYREAFEKPIWLLDRKKTRVHEYPVLARAMDHDWTNRFENCRQFIQALKKAHSAPRGKKPRRSFSSAECPTIGATSGSKAGTA